MEKQGLKYLNWWNGALSRLNRGHHIYIVNKIADQNGVEFSVHITYSDRSWFDTKYVVVAYDVQSEHNKVGCL